MQKRIHTSKQTFTSDITFADDCELMEVADIKQEDESCETLSVHHTGWFLEPDSSPSASSSLNSVHRLKRTILVLRNRSAHYYSNGDYIKALKPCEELYSTICEHGRSVGELRMETMDLLSRIYFKLDTNEHLLKGIALMEQMPVMFPTALRLGSAYEQVNDPRNAIKHYTVALQHSFKMRNVRALVRMAHLIPNAYDTKRQDDDTNDIKNAAGLAGWMCAFRAKSILDQFIESDDPPPTMTAKAQHRYLVEVHTLLDALAFAQNSAILDQLRIWKENRERSQETYKNPDTLTTYLAANDEVMNDAFRKIGLTNLLEYLHIHKMMVQYAWQDRFKRSKMVESAYNVEEGKEAS